MKINVLFSDDAKFTVLFVALPNIFLFFIYFYVFINPCVASIPYK